MSAAKPPIRVLLADNQQLFRLGFERLLEGHPEMELLAVASSGSHVLGLVRSQSPDVLVTEQQLDDMSGPELVRKITAGFPALGIVVLSMDNTEYSICRMLSAGALGYVLKSSENREVLNAIRAAARGEKHFCRPVTDKLRTLKAARRLDPETMEIREFTATEIRILKMILDGADTKAISNRMLLTVNAVKKYRKSIIEKAGVKNVAGLVEWAGENGFFGE